MVNLPSSVEFFVRADRELTKNMTDKADIANALQSSAVTITIHDCLACNINRHTPGQKLIPIADIRVMLKNHAQVRLVLENR